MYIVISTAQTDLGLRSGTLSQKINKLPRPTFYEITPVWQYLKIVYGQMSFRTEFPETSHYVLNLRYRPPTPNLNTSTTRHKIT